MIATENAAGLRAQRLHAGRGPDIKSRSTPFRKSRPVWQHRFAAGIAIGIMLALLKHGILHGESFFF